MSTIENDNEDKKKINDNLKMEVIYKALENGWTVKKSSTDSRTFEFSKSDLIKTDYKGLLIFTKSNVCEDICANIKNHLEQLNHVNSNIGSAKLNQNEIIQKNKRSVSSPIVRNLTN